MAMKRLPTSLSPTFLRSARRNTVCRCWARACCRTCWRRCDRALEIELRLKRFDLRGIGGIENVQLGEALDLAERQSQDFRAEARAAHAEQQRVLELRLLDVGGDVLERRRFRRAAHRRCSASRATSLRRRPSKAKHRVPTGANLVVIFPVVDGRLDGAREFGGEFVTLAI